MLVTLCSYSSNGNNGTNGGNATALNGPNFYPGVRANNSIIGDTYYIPGAQASSGGDGAGGAGGGGGTN